MVFARDRLKGELLSLLDKLLAEHKRLQGLVRVPAEVGCLLREVRLDTVHAEVWQAGCRPARVSHMEHRAPQEQVGHLRLAYRLGH